VVKHYDEAGNSDRLYEEVFSLMQSCEHDLELAGAALLGYDTRLIVEEKTRQALLDVLGHAVKRDRLIVHMARSMAAALAIPSRFIGQFELGLGLAAL
jgi:predicted nucleotidyltransferase